MNNQKRRKYDAAFKQEAIQLYRDSGKSCVQIERELGIGHGILARWIREYTEDSTHSFRGNGKMRPDDLKVRQLEKELARVKRERDILKKAVSIFSQEPNRYSGS